MLFKDAPIRSYPDYSTRMAFDAQTRGKPKNGVRLQMSARYRQFKFHLGREDYNQFEGLIRRVGRDQIEDIINHHGQVVTVWGQFRGRRAIRMCVDRLLDPMKTYRSGTRFECVVNLTTVPRFDVIRGLILLFREYFPEREARWTEMDENLINLWERFRDNHSVQPHTSKRRRRNKLGRDVDRGAGET